MFQSDHQANLELQSVANYVQSLETLEMFLENVSVQISSIYRRHVFGKIATEMIKSFSMFSIKVTKLWLDFVCRLDANNFGVTVIHVSLLQQLVKHQLYKHALKFVSTLRLPLTISLSNYHQYLMLSTEVYLEYQRYQQAYQCISLSISIESHHIEQQFLALKFFVLISNLLNRQIEKTNYIHEVDKIKLNCRQEIQQLINQNPQKTVEFEFQVQLFAKICQNIQLNQQELKYLQQKGFLDLYLKFQKPNLEQLKKYIEKEIYNPVLYRIKCCQVKNEPIQTFETIKSLNFPTSLFKFDKKNSIMYFEHNKMSQQILDEKIDMICAIQEIIRTRPNLKIEIMNIQRYDQNEMEDDRKPTGGFFGRMVGGFFGRLP